MAVKNLNLPSFPPFNCSDDTSILFSSWKRYVKRFNFLCNSLVVTEDKQKLSLFLTLVGDDAYEIYENIIPESQEKTFEEVVTEFDNHFKPQVNTSYETFLFRKMLQRTDESTQQYYVRLHEQAQKCDFGNKELEIKQQIELSTNNSKLRKYSFQHPKKTLQELLTTAKTFEAMKIQTEEIEKQASEDVNALRKKTAPKFTTSHHRTKTCYRCGGEFPHARDCPAAGKTCYSCGKRGHFSNVCKSSTKEKHHAMGKNQRKGYYNKPLNAMQTKDQNDDNYEQLFTTTKVEGKEKHLSFTKQLLIENCNVKVLIDTGASINVLNEKTFQKNKQAIKETADPESNENKSNHLWQRYAMSQNKRRS